MSTDAAGFRFQAFAGEAEVPAPLPPPAKLPEEADDDKFVDEGHGGEALMRGHEPSSHNVPHAKESIL